MPENDDHEHTWEFDGPIGRCTDEDCGAVFDSRFGETRFRKQHVEEEEPQPPSREDEDPRETPAPMPYRPSSDEPHDA